MIKPRDSQNTRHKYKQQKNRRMNKESKRKRKNRESREERERESRRDATCDVTRARQSSHAGNANCESRPFFFVPSRSHGTLSLCLVFSCHSVSFFHSAIYGYVSSRLFFLSFLRPFSFRPFFDLSLVFFSLQCRDFFPSPLFAAADSA